MILESNKAESIKKYYEQRKEILDSYLEDSAGSNINYAELFADRFVDSCLLMSVMLAAVKMEEQDQMFIAWQATMASLVDMCIIQGKTPHFTNPGVPVEFVDFEHHKNVMYVIHHIEMFIRAQSLTLEPVWWCELGEKLGIVEFSK